MKVTRTILLLALALLMTSQVTMVAADDSEQELQAKLQKKEAARQKKLRMESCLTVTRSFYFNQEQMIEEVVSNHPTLNKQRLLSKILAKMMIKCNGMVNDDQIAVLQEYKYQPDTFDYKRAGYRELVEIEWDSIYYRPKNDPPTLDEGKEPVDMTQQEIMMNSEIEDYSDELKRESEQELRSQMGKTSVAFFDVQAMGTFTQLIYLVLILSLFGGVAYFFYRELFVPKMDPNEERKAKLRERKEKKAQ